MLDESIQDDNENGNENEQRHKGMSNNDSTCFVILILSIPSNFTKKQKLTGI